MASNNLRSSSPALSTYSDNTQKIRRDTAAVGMAEKVPLVVINDNYLDENIEDSLPKHDIDDIPMMMSRAGFDGEGDNLDDNKKPQLYPNGSGRLFPYPPGLRYGTETGSILPDGESLPDVNIYQQKKTLAKGMMDLALFSANVNQLRYVLQSSSKHPYYYPSLVFISISLIFQVSFCLRIKFHVA
ncbi:Ninjurin domain containing protein [Asbolus verrucosus]|uniref:Ninjurin domain containing protein n=1 Tax=Asbolus verrucosus TaxID=1661398 RepID=A0A482V2A3_ASBVE|nr:Ninjurin domain containing protein [Asbolus verrucosus]